MRRVKKGCRTGSKDNFCDYHHMRCSINKGKSAVTHFGSVKLEKVKHLVNVKHALQSNVKNTRQKRAGENANAEEREARAARDKERKRVKLATETDKQREKHLNYHRERRKYLTQDLNSQQQNLQQIAIK
ncbi:hypothetical protein RhiirC2_718621 [Rhizophagus irregularis]|uniref:Uncharacterized protein n=1 Tax=Rhizophagus irregularis TaxID=588596 RepID=A0A2N1MHQ6_9GLOM|nr:hypothetical protein RhiirC2_718621 [Rhizophagus irregularis]